MSNTTFDVQKYNLSFHREKYMEQLEFVADSYLKKFDYNDINIDLILSDTERDLSVIDATIIMDIISDKIYKDYDENVNPEDDDEWIDPAGGTHYNIEENPAAMYK